MNVFLSWYFLSYIEGQIHISTAKGNISFLLMYKVIIFLLQYTNKLCKSDGIRGDNIHNKNNQNMTNI